MISLLKRKVSYTTERNNLPWPYIIYLTVLNPISLACGAAKIDLASKARISGASLHKSAGKVRGGPKPTDLFKQALSQRIRGHMKFLVRTEELSAKRPSSRARSNIKRNVPIPLVQE